MPARHLGHQVGGGGRHHDQIGFAREPDMADIELGRGIEQIGEDAFAGQRAGRERRDELLRGRRQDAADGGAALLQPADEIERLVGRDAAADDEQHARSLCRAIGRGARRDGRLVLRRGARCEAFVLRVAVALRARTSSPAAISRRMVRASSSIERPFCAARRRSRALVVSSSWRMVRLAMGSPFRPDISR